MAAGRSPLRVLIRNAAARSAARSRRHDREAFGFESGEIQIG